MDKPWDERMYQTIAVRRSQFFKPIAVVLSKFGITPDFVTFVGVLLMVAFIFEVGHNLTAGFWLLVGTLLCDQVDGAIARYKKTDSDHGKFIDVMADTTSFSLFLIGLMRAGLISSTIGGLFIYFAVTARAIMMISKNTGRKSDWLFFAGAGPLPSTLVFILYALFTLSVFTGFDHVQIGAQILTIAAVVVSLAEFLRVRAKTY